MLSLRKILVLPGPGTAPTPALQRAAVLAARHNAELHLCAVAHSGALAALRALQVAHVRQLVDTQMRKRHAELSEQAGHLRAQHIAASCSVLWGAPMHEVAAAMIARLQPDLVLHDVGELPSLHVAALTPSDWHLLRLCPAPLMLVKTAAGPGRPVIAAVDTANEHGKPPGLNEAIVETARALSEAAGAELHLTQGFQDLTEYLQESPLNEVAVGIHREAMAKHKAEFEQFAERQRVPPAHRHFLVGYSMERAIADLVHSQNADLLVLGTIRRTGLDRLLVGSTAERLLSQVTCNVLALKPPGFAQDFGRYLNVAEADYLELKD